MLTISRARTSWKVSTPTCTGRNQSPSSVHHLLSPSCDKYWACLDGLAELRTCGNGLAFIDTDESYKLEQCAELHLVECGERTELEPAISTPNCPRLYGTFADPEDCGVFWKCQDGKANRYDIGDFTEIFSKI